MPLEVEDADVESHVEAEETVVDFEELAVKTDQHFNDRLWQPRSQGLFPGLGEGRETWKDNALGTRLALIFFKWKSPRGMEARFF